MQRSQTQASHVNPLSRTATKKLLQQMYSLQHWIDLIRLFRHKTLTMDQARKDIQALVEKYGKEPIASACEALVEVSTKDSETTARLKPHIRDLAFQMIGSEPPPSPSPPVVDATAIAEPEEPEPTAGRKKKPTKKLAKKSAAKVRKVQAPAEMVTGEERPEPTRANGTSALMQQYRDAKARHPAMLLLFRMGDFYELFGPDAETAAKLLGLTLTTRDRTLTIAGFPHHQLEAYLHKLLKAGERVAICEPVEESLARGPIRREITRVVTPGTLAGDDACHVDYLGAV